MIELNICSDGVPVTLVINQVVDQGVVLKLNMPSWQGQRSPGGYLRSAMRGESVCDDTPFVSRSPCQQVRRALWSQWRHHFQELLAQS